MGAPTEQPLECRMNPTPHSAPKKPTLTSSLQRDVGSWRLGIPSLVIPEFENNGELHIPYPSQAD